jgi:hypothetical protein
MQEKRAAKHKGFRWVEPEAIAAQKRCRIPQRINVGDRVVSEHRQGTGDIRHQWLNRCPELHVGRSQHLPWHMIAIRSAFS